MKKEKDGGLHKIAQNADFAQSRRGKNPDITVPWFLAPCLRCIYPQKPILSEVGLEGENPDIMPKVVLYNLADEASANKDAETEHVMAIMREYAERSRYLVVEELCDCGCGEDMIRPGLSGLLEMAKNKRISGVLTVSPSAISRNIYQLLAYREELERYGVWIKFCDF